MPVLASRALGYITHMSVWGRDLGCILGLGLGRVLYATAITQASHRQWCQTFANFVRRHGVSLNCHRRCCWERRHTKYSVYLVADRKNDDKKYDMIETAEGVGHSLARIKCTRITDMDFFFQAQWRHSAFAGCVNRDNFRSVWRFSLYVLLLVCMTLGSWVRYGVKKDQGAL